MNFIFKIKGKLMVHGSGISSQIFVCIGPGCKAWDSEKLLKKLKGSIYNGYNVNVSDSKCLNNCGGGVTVKLPKSNELVKVREIDNLNNKLLEIFK